MRSSWSCGGGCFDFLGFIISIRVVVGLNGGSRYIRIHVDCTRYCACLAVRGEEKEDGQRTVILVVEEGVLRMSIQIDN